MPNPSHIGAKVRRLAGRIRPVQDWLDIRIGQFASVEPLSRQFGYDRGQPIDRFYIEEFLATNRQYIAGRVLEVGDASYSREFGGDQITQQDVFHVHAENPAATIIGDLSQEGVLPPASFDCMVLTQTLHLIYDMKAAVRQMRLGLKPGGTVLVTVPGITPVDRGEWGKSWYWALTPAAAKRLFEDEFGADGFSVTAFGNVFAATAFLHGAAQEEIDLRKLKPYDEAYPVIVAIRATAAA